MKFFFLLLIAILVIVSCEDNQTNEVSLQAKVNDKFYKSTDASAYENTDGSVTIQGFTQFESLTLHLENLRNGNFAIRAGSQNYAVFEGMDGNVYSTRPNGEGTVTISNVNETNKTLTGIFNFTAILSGIDTIYVSKGVIFEVSYK